MGPIQSGINNLLGVAGVAATTLKSNFDKANKEAIPEETPKKEYQKPTMEEGYYIKGNIVSQEEINRKYNQNAEFRKRLDAAKERVAKNAESAIQANQTEFERQKLEKKKEKSIKLLEQIRKGGDK